ESERYRAIFDDQARRDFAETLRRRDTVMERLTAAFVAPYFTPLAERPDKVTHRVPSALGRSVLWPGRSLPLTPEGSKEPRGLAPRTGWLRPEPLPFRGPESAIWAASATSEEHQRLRRDLETLAVESGDMGRLQRRILHAYGTSDVRDASAGLQGIETGDGPG